MKYYQNYRSLSCLPLLTNFPKSPFNVAIPILSKS